MQFHTEYRVYTAKMSHGMLEIVPTSCKLAKQSFCSSNKCTNLKDIQAWCTQR